MGKKVTVVGAGFYGSTTAQRLAEYNIFDTVVLTDIVEGKPEGLALDLNQSRSIEASRPVVGRDHRPAQRGTTSSGLTCRHHRRPTAQTGHEPDGPARINARIVREAGARTWRSTRRARSSS
jgi:malate dehydrogenase